jgi:hypothetical protein
MINEKSDRNDSINPHFVRSINVDESDIIMMPLHIYPANLITLSAKQGCHATHRARATRSFVEWYSRMWIVADIPRLSRKFSVFSAVLTV